MQDKKQDNEKIPLNKFIIKYRLAILAFLIITLAVISFLGGAIYSCNNGNMKGLICIQPTQVATINVCETHPVNCIEKCENFIVNDLSGLCSEFT
jgi:hypothetical protein